MLDDFNHEELGIEVDISLLSERITCALDRIIEWRGKPRKFVVDNEPKNISGLHHCWTEKRGTQLDYIQPRKPQQNAYMECHNRTTWHEWFEMKELANIEEI